MRVVLSCLALVLLFTAGRVAAQTTLNAPAEAVIGSTVAVEWAGPWEKYDALQIVPAGAAAGAKALHAASILNTASPKELRMPEEPGMYEVRYWDAKGKRVLARHQIRAYDIPTSLDAPERVQTGEKINVTWDGPGNQYDLVALFEPSAGMDTKPAGAASITSRRNPVSLRVPDAPGTYELRYVTRQLKRVLATRPITVEGVPTSLDAPTQAQIGEEIEVTWDGPGNQYDLVALFEAGAPDDAKPAAAASIVSRQNPVSLKLPEAGGAYELRYMTAQSKTVLARRAIQIGEVAASLDAPDAATAGTRIDVSWTGPGNDYDLIGVFETSAPETAEPLAGNTILSGRNPIRVRLPESNGSYELRYRTRQSKRVLARRPIEIGPAGQIEVVYERATTTTASEGVGAVALILDASGSMLKRENGVRRIEIAKQVLDELVREGLQDEQPFALRVFGHKEADACRTDLELPLRPLDREQAASAIAGVNAMNLAKTPIAASLALVPSDLAGASGPKTIVLITDGEETCEGDPEAVIRDLRARGLDVRVSVVGFAIDDADLRSEFEGWADLGGGAYFDARSAEDLSESLRTVLSGPFSVLDASGTVVAEGVIGGAPVRVPAGVYRIATAGQSAAASDVRVTAGDVTRVEL